MHDDEVIVDADVVHALVSRQFPQWASLPVTHASSAGTDNAMFRLGDRLVVRLPRIPWSAGNVEHEQRWLPVIGPLLPIATPEPVGLGEPDLGYPWGWSIYTWLDGDNPRSEDVVGQLVLDIAHCLDVLHAIDEPGGPQNHRGLTFDNRDAATRTSIGQLTDLLAPAELAAVTAVWDEAFALATTPEPGTWIHADVAPGNLLVRDGRLVGLIDFAGVSRGDPAIDVCVAWNLVPRHLRGVFREALAIDDATWLRSRAWSLSQACLQLPYYHQTNKPLAAQARHVIGEVLDDWRG
jgi:aminoglycoside phosphotransferase (APT) family kinase protein